MTLPVPFRRQHHDYTCGPACLRMVLEHFGVRASREQLHKRTRVSEARGTSHANLLSAARSFGLRCAERRGATLGEVDAHLKAGRPVIVNFREPSNEEGHYAVVISVRSDVVVLNDPWNGGPFRLGRAEFLRRWRNMDGTSVRWMVALGPLR